MWQENGLLPSRYDLWYKNGTVVISMWARCELFFPLCIQKRSSEYNADIQVYTIRYAMTEQLRNPPAGIYTSLASCLYLVWHSRFITPPPFFPLSFPFPISSLLTTTISTLSLASFLLPGLQDIIPVHFALQREPILKQCSQWLNESISEEYEQKLTKAIDELRAELDKIWCSWVHWHV